MCNLCITNWGVTITLHPLVNHLAFSGLANRDDDWTYNLACYFLDMYWWACCVCPETWHVRWTNASKPAMGGHVTGTKVYLRQMTHRTGLGNRTTTRHVTWQATSSTCTVEHHVCAQGMTCVRRTNASKPTVGGGMVHGQKCIFAKWLTHNMNQRLGELG